MVDPWCPDPRAQVDPPLYLSPMLSASAFSRTFVLSFSMVLYSVMTAQTNIDFVSQLSYQDLRGCDLSNLWGYTDELGNEYALMGVNGNGPNTGGISVVDLSDPTDPQEIFFYAGPTSIWREIKVWEDHAYITTEADNGGLVIVDLSPLPQSTDLPVTVWYDPAWDTSHSLFIDENGRLFIHGANEGNGGAIMYDLTQDPMAPVRLGVFDNWYIHDSYARGDTLYAGHILNGFFTIVDVSDPANPQLLGQQTTPNAFTHNVWLDASGQHLFTTDERTSSYVGSYDVSDPADIQFLDKLQSDPGSGAIPHNTYWLPSGHVVQSYYTYGVTIYDASRPDNLVEVGHYDTSPLIGDGFNGAWGVYPFFSSGRLIISDIQEGLFVLDPTYVRACWLEGLVTDASTGIPVGQANVSIAGTQAFDVTAFDGIYGTGYVQGGTFSVVVNAPGYFPATVEGVFLQNGEVTVLNIELDPLPSYQVSGIVRTAVSGTPVAGAQVELAGIYYFTTTTDADGAFQFPVVYDGTYEVTVGRWGWRTACPADLVIAGAGTDGLVIELEQGYNDDFALDLGWQTATTAARGGWVRGIPQGTTDDGVSSNPGSDIAGDCRSRAYVTGNGGGSAGADDVDEGGTLLTSPVFDATGLPDPHIRFWHWFYNAGGAGPVDDELVFSLTDGTDTVVIRTINSNNSVMSQWRFNNIRIADHLPPNSTMRLLVFTSDEQPDGHLLEAGFDGSGLVPDATTGLDEQLPFANGIRVWPNPSAGAFTIQLPEGMEADLQVFDAVGRIVLGGLRTVGGQLVLQSALPTGSYIVRATTQAGQVFNTKLLVGR